MTKEALNLALEVMQNQGDVSVDEWIATEKAIKEALAQPQQEPVAWLLTDKNINSLQVDSIQRLIDRLKHAHHTDLCVRINGQDEWFQADWLKHMVRASPPQRTWVGLTDDEEIFAVSNTMPYADRFEFARAIEAKLKEKNG
jgi:predicted house-cleaning noncanonical NTP pyrophosphatase (MazG superfamily)